MRRPRDRQSRALRQHGGATHGVLRRHVEPLADGRARRQARRRLRVRQHAARRPGDDAARHAAAAVAPRHADRRPAVYGAGADRNVGRRHALWREPARARGRTPLARRRRARARAGARRPRRDGRAQALRRRMSARADRAARFAVAAWTLLAACIAAWPFAGLGIGRVTAMIAFLPLLLPLPGIVRRATRALRAAPMALAPALALAITETLVNPA